MNKIMPSIIIFLITAIVSSITFLPMATFGVDASTVLFGFIGVLFCILGVVISIWLYNNKNIF